MTSPNRSPPGRPCSWLAARDRRPLRRRHRRRRGRRDRPLADQRRAAASTSAGPTAAAVDDAVERAQAAFLQWRTVPAPARGALVKRFGELLAEHKDDLADPDQPRGRQDHLRGPRRGPGDDRHLRLRGRPLPPALRPDHALGAARPPADGDLAPARRRRRHQRLQLPGRGLVVEHRDRPGLRRPGHLEALGAHPADRARLPRGAGPGHRRVRRPGGPLPGRSSVAPRSGRRSSTTPASPCSAPPAPPGWGAPSARGSPSASAARCSSSAATTPPSSARPRTST